MSSVIPCEFEGYLNAYGEGLSLTYVPAKYVNLFLRKEVVESSFSICCLSRVNLREQPKGRKMEWLISGRAKHLCL